MIKSTLVLILLLMILSLGVTLSPPKQVWAISEESTMDIITTVIETFGPMLGGVLNPENPEESEPTGNPPSIMSPAPFGSIDPCADPGANPGLEGLCGGYQPDTLPNGSNDPCADPGANPSIADLCGGAPGWNDPCADPALADLCGGYPPYDPVLVMRQFWENFEAKLSYFAPQYQQAVLSELRLMIEQGLAPYPPEQQQEAIQMLQQTMSPGLSEAVLPT